MSKAQQVIKVMNELSGSPVSSAKDLKSNDNLVFKDGSQYAGMIARFHSANPDGTVNVYVGKSNRMSIPVSDLLLLSGTANNDSSGVGDAKPAGGTKVAADGAQAG